MVTHHWSWRIDIENEARNSHAFIEFLWYSPLAVFFTASWVAGPEPMRKPKRAPLRVSLRGQEAGEHFRRADAWAQAEKLCKEAPATCREDVLDPLRVLHDAIYGRGKYVPPE
jgi:hypothetical protein